MSAEDGETDSLPHAAADTPTDPPGVMAEVLRGNIHITAAMEVLQTGYLHAVAAAAGCALSKPLPDVHGTDYNVSHGSAQHTTDTVADIKIQMKATSTVARDIVTTKEDFAFQLDNKDLSKLNISTPHIPRLLVVLLLPKDQSAWLRASHEELTLRHCAYWVNLEGVSVTGQERTTVRISLDHMFDDRALCEIMRKVGAGEKPV
jgi:Domain of unknown function (DUF4365)